MRKWNHGLVGACVAAGILLGVSACGPGSTFVTIGTGSVTGVYYPVGGAIAKMVNEKHKELGIRASVESTGGSVYNINAVLSGDLEFGIAQSDRQFQAWSGEADWDGKPAQALRGVFSLHPEIVTLVASDDSGIRSLADLKGKRVNLGNPGSGTRGNAMQVLQAAGIDPESDLQAESLKASDAPKMIQDNRIDAFFFTVGHPSGAIQEATAGKRKVRFVPITGMEKLLSEHTYYTTATIPKKKLYPMAAGEEDVPSISMVTTVVTSDRVSVETVYAVTREVFENLDTFQSLHPALASLTPERMLEGRTAPLHPGAEKYFREAGLSVP
jgi:hypothetical protein